MAGLRGNQAYLLSAVQTAKATPPTAWKDKNFFTSNASISPTHQIGQLSETDSNRQAGNNYVQQTGFEGAPQFYVRDDSIHSWLYYVLGAKADSGASDFTHTITPAAAIPYVTFGRGIGNTLFEQFNDGMVSDLTIAAGTAQPLTATATVMGLTAVRQAAEWTAGLAPPAASALAPYNFNQATVTLGGSATALISSFNCSISNNVTVQQTDDSIPYDVVPGTFQVTLGFDMIFETLTEYNKFLYGGASGTTQSPTIFTTSAVFLFTVGAKNDIQFTFPSIAYETFPVDPDPGGSPITVSVTAAAQRSASPFVTAVVHNQIAI
jgi:hypothetical protein